MIHTVKNNFTIDEEQVKIRLRMGTCSTTYIPVLTKAITVCIFTVTKKGQINYVLSSPLNFLPTSSPEAIAVLELFCCSISSEYSSFSGYKKDMIRPLW